MKKLNLILIWALMMAVTITGALALENVSQYGISNQHQWWNPVWQMGTAPYTSNWTDAGQDDNMPLVYDLNNDGVNEIIQSRSGTIKVYALNGSVIASTYISGLDSRQITAFDAVSCLSGRGIYVVLSDSTLSVQCLVNNTLSEGWACSGLASSTPDFTGASVFKFGGNNIAIYYCEGSIGQHNACWCGDAYSNSTTIGLGSTYAQTWRGTPPHGNLKNDGHEYFVFPYSELGNRVGVTLVGDNHSVSTIVPLAGSYSADSMDRQPMVIKRGSGQPDELLIPYVTSSQDFLWFGDATNYTIQNSIGYGTANMLTSQLTNAVQLGENDICFKYELNDFYIGNVYGFVCWYPVNSSFSYTTTGVYLGYYNDVGRITSADMNDDAYADFFFSRGASGGAELCLYTNHTNSLNCSVLGGEADYVYGVDVDNDGYRDIVYSDSANNNLKVWRTGSATPPAPTFCNDTDKATYPSINYTLQGIMTATGITPRTDYCVGNYVMEYYCDNSSSYHSVPVSYDCTAIGNVCVNGSCVAGASNGTCDDSDILTYPSINYNLSGSVVTNNGTELTYTDFCYGSNYLLEYYCGSPTIPLVTNTSYWCGSVGKICSGGQCIANTTNTTPCTGVTCSNTCDGNYLMVNGTCLVSGGGYICAYDALQCPSGCSNGACSGTNTTFCSDTDKATFPTTNYTRKGTLSATGLVPQTDYCWGDFVYEFYCDNSTNYHTNPYYNCTGLLCDNIYPELHDCAGDGQVCVDGACTGSNITGNCSDTDRATFPSLNETKRGVVTITLLNGSTNYTDYCSGSSLTEYYCNHPALPIISNTTYSCYSFGMDCVAGECVPRVNQTCSDSDIAYSQPQMVAGNIQLKVNGVVTFQKDDECYNSTIVREYYCPTNESYSLFASDCTLYGAICSEGRCVDPSADTGIPISDLRWCWSETNGSFDWSCCSEQESLSKSALCPLKVGAKYALGSVATFVLSNFIYFLILIIIFVMITPYIVPKLRGQ